MARLDFDLGDIYDRDGPQVGLDGRLHNPRYTPLTDPRQLDMLPWRLPAGGGSDAFRSTETARVHTGGEDDAAGEPHGTRHFHCWKRPGCVARLQRNRSRDGPVRSEPNFGLIAAPDPATNHRKLINELAA